MAITNTDAIIKEERERQDEMIIYITVAPLLVPNTFARLPGFALRQTMPQVRYLSQNKCESTGVFAIPTANNLQASIN